MRRDPPHVLCINVQTQTISRYIRPAGLWRARKLQCINVEPPERMRVLGAFRSELERFRLAGVL